MLDYEVIALVRKDENKVNTWSITHKGFDPESHNHIAPVNTVGNGFVCCRGFMEEQHTGIAGLGGIYMSEVFGNGSFTPMKREGQELVNAPNFLWVDIALDSVALQVAPERMRDYEETLDMKHGVFTRRYKYLSGDKPLADLTFTRFVSRADVHLAGQSISVTPLKEALDIRVSLGFDSEVKNLNNINNGPGPIQPGKKHSHAVYRDAYSLCSRVDNKEGNKLAFAQKVIAPGADVYPEGNVIVVHACIPAGETVTIQKLIAIVASSHNNSALIHALSRMDCSPSYDDVLNAHKSAMVDFWENADVTIEGDDESLRSLRYNIFQFAQSCPRHAEDSSIGARGLTGELYEGGVFWDTEIFMLPYLTMTDPDTARKVLMFRHKTLPEAKTHAEANWFKGAMYGWHVNSKGVEQTPVGDGAYYSVHVIADIAFAVSEYWNASGDDAFIIVNGLEILIETARFWASRVTRREDGLYDIMAVRGPNDYGVLVNNNLYTNMMARENLLSCERILRIFTSKHRQLIDSLTLRLNLDRSEIDEWLEIAKNIVLPFDAGRGLWLEDETWLRRKPIDIEVAKPSAQPIIDTTIPYEALPFYQIANQADVILVMKNLPWRFTDDQIAVAFDHYKTKTAFDSSHAYSVFALTAARLGRPAEALGYFDECINLDLRNVQLNTINGLHCANFSGAWQVAIFGFGGVSIKEDKLEIAPNLPVHWNSLSFHLHYRDSLLHISASHNEICVRMLEYSGVPVKLSIHGKFFELSNPGEEVVLVEEKAS